MKFTPHHHGRLSALPVSQSSSGSGETLSSGGGTPVGPLRTAFAGITPRPGRGRGHPLAQAHIPDSASSAGDGDHLASPELRVASVSFISNASSHDLTTHPRANTSYDPALGTGQRGVARFDAPKLNHYLHTLNSKLQEENKALVDRLRKYEEVKDAEQRRLSLESMSAGKGRRISAGSALGDVEEEAEGWAEEKRNLEELVENLEIQVDKLAVEKESVDEALEAEQRERARDKERWRERMQEVESGVAEIVGDLETKILEGERALEERTKEAERIREQLQSERDLALERAVQAETAMVNGKELGGAVKEANSRVSMLTANLQSATAQIKDMEEEIVASDRRVDELEKELKEEKISAKLANDDLHGQLSEMGAEVMRSSARASELEKELKAQEAVARRLQHELDTKADELADAQELLAQSDVGNNEEVRELRTYTAELEEAAAAATERIQDLEEQLTSAQDHVNRLEAEEQETNDHVEALEKEAERASLLLSQMEDALDAAEQKMHTDEEVVADLKAKVSTLEREREREREMSRLLKGRHSEESNAEIENALEAELEQAHKEIAKLNELLQHSPARRAIDAAKDQRIETLEKDKEQLQARIKALRSSSFEMATPNKGSNLSGISPIHRQVLSMSIRAPKTPGGPLKDVSWCHESERSFLTRLDSFPG
jgi:DNA repair exonuclease SbcCD ATPase subunit